jgi:4-amino-4-deoxy-L-arabinose transferase-like glycosyltransferase
LIVPAALWLAVVASALAFRPLLPIDETRYLTVAWEMWIRGDFLVPHLNGATYAHKPPVLFWLIDAVWAVVGVHEWAGRIVPPLFGLASLAMMPRLARLLWPGDHDAARLAPLVFAGAGAVAVYGSLAMFDMPLTFFSLIAVEGILRAWRGAAWGWLLCGAALGLALLTKGPVALLHVLPLPILAPLWAGSRPAGGWAKWYGFTLAAIVLGAAIGLAWAIPAALAGGEAYAGELLWGQTADRMVRSFAHRRPLWWYLPVLPALLFPWVFVPRLWRNARLRGEAGDCACLLWFVVPLLVFSLVSGKQAQYLLPELVPATLLASRWLKGMRVERIASVTAVLAVLANAAFLLPYFARYDLSAAAAYLDQAARAGRPIAHPPDYEGEFNFLARLHTPLTILGGPDVVSWAKANPGALLVVTRSADVPTQWRPEATFPYRGKTIALWGATAILESEGRVMGDRY